MRRVLFAALALSIAIVAPLCCPAALAAETPSSSKFLKIRTPGAPAMLPDGSPLQRDWPDGVFQVCRVTPKHPGPDASYAPENVTRTRLTDFPDGAARFSLSPDGKRGVVMFARGGNENTQLSLFDPMAPGIAPLTPVLANPRVQATVNRWMRDGSGFFYSANDESPNDFYLYLYEFATGKARKILGEAGSWEVAAVTDDGKRVLVVQSVSASDSHVWELDLATAKRRELTLAPKSGMAACEVVGYCPQMERGVVGGSDFRGSTLVWTLTNAKNAGVNLSRFAVAARSLRNGSSRIGSAP